MSSTPPSRALAQAGAPQRAAFAAVLALFAASGCAALIYQVVWFEQLGLVIGASALSLGVLLATFLGGLGIGSLLIGRLAPTERPLRRYALLELLIGAVGLGALYGIPWLGNAYTAWAGTGTLGLMLRLCVAAVALLPATILMGATLPTVAAWLRVQPHGVTALGGCYAANIAGSVAGSVLAGFYLLRLYDATVATFVAAALNLGCAVIAAFLAARAAPVTPPATRTATGTWDAWPIYAATAISGMTALAAEVLWTRHLSLLLGGTVYTFALILAVFLAGLGIGSAVGATVSERRDPHLALALCQGLLCFTVAGGAYTLARSLPYWPIDVTLPAAADSALLLDLLRVACVVLPSAVLWGASFPLALAAAAGARGPERVIGPLYAANTLGAIVGALATTFVLITAIGSARTQQLATLLSACAGLLALGAARHASRSTSERRLAGAALIAAPLALTTLAPPPELPAQLVAYGRFLPTRGQEANVVYVGEGLTASIAVSREPDGTLTYHNAGKTQASTYPQDLRLQRMLGHLSTLLVDRPAAVLVIGLGSGITAGAVSIDPAVERVVVAEIEPLVPSVAERYFGPHNYDVVRNPKTEIRVDDGRHVLATSGERFDAITSDPLDPWVKGAAALYTHEFWQLCKARLNDGGVVTVFVQLYESTAAAVRSEIATFLDVFPNGAVFANTVDGMGYDLVLVARKTGQPIDLDALERRLERADYAPVARSLRDVGFDSGLDLASTYSGGAADFATWLADAPRNTDRDLRLQYLAGEGLNRLEAGAIFSGLTGDSLAWPSDLFAGSPATLEELRQRLAARRGEY